MNSLSQLEFFNYFRLVVDDWQLHRFSRWQRQPVFCKLVKSAADFLEGWLVEAFGEGDGFFGNSCTNYLTTNF
ncbi:MAG: hypothetical protein AAGG75_17310 [Bacteroidota bacterium]